MSDPIYDAPIYANHDDQFVDVSGLNKAELLMAIFNETKPKPLDKLLGRHTEKKLTLEKAQRCINNHDGEYLVFDTLYGRPLSVNLSGNQIDARLFDKRHNKAGKLRSIIERLRPEHQPLAPASA